MMDGARDYDAPGPSILCPERLARMAEADNFLPGFADRCHRSRRRQTVARWLVTLALAAAAAWIVSEIAVAGLLDKGNLAMIGIGP